MQDKPIQAIAVAGWDRHAVKTAALTALLTLRAAEESSLAER